MKLLTVRQVAENSGVSVQAVRQWQADDFTPEAVANMVMEKAEYKEKQARLFLEQAKKMRTYAQELQESQDV